MGWVLRRTLVVRAPECAALGTVKWFDAVRQRDPSRCVSSAPQAAEATFVDKKCPFTGNVSIRGRILTGTIATMKMKRYVAVQGARGRPPPPPPISTCDCK